VKKQEREPADTELLDAIAVAEMLCCSIRTVWKIVAKGELPVVRFSRKHVRFRRSDVLDLIERHRIAESYGDKPCRAK
jgi:excisionase family DNA binding protein